MGNNLEIKNQINLLNMIHISLLVGMLLFLIVVIILIRGDQLIENRTLDKVFMILAPLYGLIIMFFSRLIYNVSISKYLDGTDLANKIVHYRSAKIVSWALVESACFFALVATILTSNYLYVAVFIFLFGYFIMLRPSRQSLVSELQLSSNEIDLIINK